MTDRPLGVVRPDLTSGSPLSCNVLAKRSEARLASELRYRNVGNQHESHPRENHSRLQHNPWQRNVGVGRGHIKSKDRPALRHFALPRQVVESLYRAILA